MCKLEIHIGAVLASDGCISTPILIRKQEVELHLSCKALAGDAAVVDLLLSNQTETTNTATQQSFVAIVPPQTASADVFLTIASGNDSYLSAKILSKKELTAGKCYTVTVTVKKRELVVDSSDITPWTPGGSDDSDAILQ